MHNIPITKIDEQKTELLHGLKWENLEKMHNIDVGTTGEVSSYYDKTQNKTFAVKLLEDDGENETQEKIQKEIQLLKTIDALPNASQYFPIFYGNVYLKIKKTKELKTFKFYGLIFEKLDFSLYDLIEKKIETQNKIKSKNEFNEEENIFLSFSENFRLFKTIIMGLALLQQHNIAHRDIKTKNIVCNRLINGELYFKIIDLGEAKINFQDDENTIIGTKKYFSPEINYFFLNNLQYVEKNILNPWVSDVYSVGLVMLYANCGNLSFQKERKKEKDINPLNSNNGPYDDKIKNYIILLKKSFVKFRKSDFLIELYEKCLIYNPFCRPDFLKLKELLQEIELNNICDNCNEKENTINTLKQDNRLLFQDKLLLLQELDEKKKELDKKDLMIKNLSSQIDCYKNLSIKNKESDDIYPNLKNIKIKPPIIHNNSMKNLNNNQNNFIDNFKIDIMKNSHKNNEINFCPPFHQNKILVNPMSIQAFSMNNNCHHCNSNFNEKEMKNLECKHSFCSNCLTQHFTIMIESKQANISNMNCLICKKSIKYEFLKKFLPRDLFEKYDKLIAEQCIQNELNNDNSSNINCPNINCSKLVQIDNNLSYCICYYCRFQFCISCCIEWNIHKGLTCNQVRMKFN